MALIAPLREMLGERTAERGMKGRRYRVVYQAASDSLADTPYTIAIDPLLPKVRQDVHPDDSSALCMDISATHFDDDRLMWRISVAYESPQGAETYESLLEADPTRRPPDRRWSSYKVSDFVGKDLDGKPFCNAAKEPFDPALELTRRVYVLNISRNEAEFSPDTMIAYLDCVNSATWYGAPPGAALMDDITASQASESGYYYWRVDYTIHFKLTPPMWKTRQLNLGFRARNPLFPTEYNLITEKTAEGVYMPVQTPRLLDANGYVLWNFEDPNYLDFRNREWADFAALQLEPGGNPLNPFHQVFVLAYQYYERWLRMEQGALNG